MHPRIIDSMPHEEQSALRAAHYYAMRVFVERAKSEKCDLVGTEFECDYTSTKFFLGKAPMRSAIPGVTDVVTSG